MTKLSKKICLTLCILATLLFSFVAFAMMSAPVVKASSSFNMIEGAQLRISGENIEETNGIRFVAEMDAGTVTTVTEANGTFGMLIIPESYRTTYASQIASAENDYVKAFEGITLLNIEGISPYEYEGSYRINGVMSNVKYDNMNVPFVGIAYYKIGDAYTYVENHATVPSRSVYQVAMSALYDTEKTYTDAEYAYLDGYKYLAECKASRLSQPDANDIKAYQDNLKALRDSFDGTTVNFDSQADLSLASLGDQYGSNFTDHQIYENSALTFTAINDGSIKISFPKAVRVYSDSVLTIKLRGMTFNLSQTYLDTYHFSSVYGSHPVALQKYGYQNYDNGSYWQTLKIDLSEASALVETDVNGNSYFYGFSIVLTGYANVQRSLYIDYISVTTAGGALLDEIAGTNYVATYNSENYSNYISTSQSYTIENGKLTIPSAAGYTWINLGFVESYTVSEGDYIVLNMGASNRTRVRRGNDTGTGKEIVTNYIYNDANNNSAYYHYIGPTVNNANDTSDDTFTPYENRTWEYLMDANCAIQKMVVPVSYLGYQVDDVVDKIGISGWVDAGTKIVIDSIEYFSTADYSNSVVADFTKEGGENLVLGNTYETGGYFNNYSVKDISYNNDGYVSVKTSSTNPNPQGVRLLIKPTNVTTDSVVSVTLRYTVNQGGSRWCRVGYGGTYTDDIMDCNGFTADGEWMTVSFKLVEKLKTNPRCTEFSDGAETMYYLCFYIQQGTLDIKTISIS